MVDKLTNEEITEFKAAFDYFDKDRDGKIDINELGGFMRNFGQNPNEDDLRGMLKDVDLNGDGVINFNEFVCLLIKDLKGVDIWKEELYEVFKVFDKNGDNFITAYELNQIMVLLGEEIDSEEINYMIKEVDMDGDGQISLEEFMNIMTKKRN